MTGKTHIIGGVAMAAATSLYSGIFFPDSASSIIAYSTFLVAAGAGAIFPDIDKRKSTISNKHPIASFFIRLFLTHRGFTHSLTFLLLCGCFLFFITPLVPFYSCQLMTGFMIGLGSHIILDSFNEKGVPLFYPYKKMFHFASIRTRGITEFFFRMGLLSFTGFILYKSFWGSIKDFLFK